MAVMNGVGGINALVVIRDIQMKEFCTMARCRDLIGDSTAVFVVDIGDVDEGSAVGK